MATWPTYSATNTHKGLQFKVHDASNTSGTDWRGKYGLQGAVFFESLDTSKCKHVLFAHTAGEPDATEVTALVAALPNTIIKIFDDSNEREYVVVSGTAIRVAYTGD